MNKARIGVIGVGWWGTEHHLDPLSRDPKTEVAAIWSRTEDKAQGRAQKYGVPRYYTDYRRMIDECEMDGVVIASTPNMHYEQARYALEHGLHVLMEKPFVLQAAHANELGRLARERGRMLSVCHPWLFYPMMAEAHKAIREGKLGKVLAAAGIFSQRVYELFQGNAAGRPGDSTDRPRPNVASYSDPAIVGGGEGHTQASHILGMLLWLTQEQPVSVFARMNNVGLHLDVVDAMTIRFANGALAAIAANGLLPPRASSIQLQIQGDQGIMNFDTWSLSVQLFLAGDKGPHKIEAPAPEGYDCNAAVPLNFARAILGEEPLYVNMEVALNEARILDAAYRSAASGKEEEIIL